MFFKKKKNYNDSFYNFIGFLQFFGFILLCSASKSCPESTRPHLTRCDKFFRCTQLPNKTYVWIPAQCDKGLVYEPSLKMCVLPGDNWECNLTEELTDINILSDENNVYGVNNIQMGDYTSEELTLNDDKSTFFGDDSSEISDSSELYIETTTQAGYSNSSTEENDEYESSGDGNFIPETKQYVINNNHVTIPESVDFDNRLTSHLQRLTQLIDNIKNQNNTNGTKNELMADQLNHFLDSYNLMSQQQTYDGNDTNKLPVPEDGQLHPDHIDEIISQQNKLTIDDVVNHSIKNRINDAILLYPMKEPNVHIKLNSEPHLVKKGYRKPPELKIPHSQIIINRPGGSVLFNIDSNNSPEKDHLMASAKVEEPPISEETLKTVLELSKQLIQNQNAKQQAYPIYYTVPIPMLSNEKQYSHKRYDHKPPISVTNSFNTYGEDFTRGRRPQLKDETHDRGNNISTTVIFDDHSTGLSVQPNKYKPVKQNTQNSQTFPTYYHPSTEIFDDYQPSYYPQYQLDNPYKGPSSYYHDPLDLYPPYLTPFYTPGSTTTTPAPTTPKPTTTTTTTTERYNGESIDDDDADDDVMDSYPDDYATGSDIPYPIRPVNYYNPLVSNLGLLQLNDDSQDKLINFGGSYISYNSYKNTLLPLLQPSTMGGGLEILTCSTGVRQPNMTDCTRYYVCTPRTQNVLSYSCPPYTAFNKGTKICDAKAYALCKPEAIINQYTVAENMRIRQEAQQVLAQAQKLRDEAFKQSTLASVFQSQSVGNTVTMNSRPLITTHQPNLPVAIATHQNQPVKKRRIRCYDTGKISDPDSPRNYWVCFRGANGRMKRQKMTCANGLIFCKSTRYCTLSKKC